MRASHVRSLVACVLLGGVVTASCTGDVGPVGPAGPKGDTGATGATGPNGPTEVEVFTATMTGAGEPTPTGSTATGTAVVTLVGGLLSYRVDVANINSVTRAHIHGPGAAGVNGPIRINFYEPPAGTAGLNFTTSATLASGVATLPLAGISQDSLVVLLRNGNAYANVHTTAFPGGEIRGQFVKK